MRTITTHVLRRYAIGALGLGMLGLAACGSSGGASSSPATGGAVPSAAPATGVAVVGIETGTNIGPVLADANGHTLYSLTNNGQPVSCTGQCAAIWPPLLLPAGNTTPATAAGVEGVGTTTVAAGTQVTAAGAPLYRFSGDKAPGATNGEGIVNFGGVWNAARVNGTSTPAPTPNVGAGAPGY